MDKLSQMAVFAEVVRQGSFSHAAKQLGLSPSAVSKLISRMEQRLDARLLNRTTRKVQLTEAGQAYYERCRVILEQVEVAEEALGEERRAPQGNLVVSCSPGYARYCLVPKIPGFLRRYPQVRIQLRLTGETENLLEEGIDLAIRLGELPDSSLVARKLSESPRIICASPDYLKRNLPLKHPSELVQHNCLCLSTTARFNQWRFQMGKNQQTLSVTGNFITDSVDTLHQMGLGGLGVIRLSAFMVADDLAAGRLIPLLEDFNKERQQVHALYAHRDHLPAKITAFLDFLSEGLDKSG